MRQTPPPMFVTVLNGACMLRMSHTLMLSSKHPTVKTFVFAGWNRMQVTPIANFFCSIAELQSVRRSHTRSAQSSPPVAATIASSGFAQHVHASNECAFHVRKGLPQSSRDHVVHVPFAWQQIAPMSVWLEIGSANVTASLHAQQREESSKTPSKKECTERTPLESARSKRPSRVHFASNTPSVCDGKRLGPLRTHRSTRSNLENIDAPFFRLRRAIHEPIHAHRKETALPCIEEIDAIAGHGHLQLLMHFRIHFFRTRFSLLASTT